jgi:hypothetical protein
MRWARNAERLRRDGHNILVGQAEVKRSFRRPRRRCEDNIKI